MLFRHQGVRMMFTHLLIVFLLHVVSGVEIKSIQTFKSSLDAKVGQNLTLPCSFYLDEPIQGNEIELEWSMKPRVGDTFKPILQLNHTELLPLENADKRVGINIYRVRKGQCSLFIKSVNPKDSGTYKIRMAINGNEFPGFKTIDVNIWEDNKETESNQPMTDEEFQSWSDDKFKLDSEDNLRLADPDQVTKDRRLVLALAITAGVTAFLLLLCGGAAIFYGCHYYRRKKRDNIICMEEGLLSEDSESSGGTSEEPEDVSTEGTSEESEDVSTGGTSEESEDVSTGGTSEESEEESA